MKIILPHQYPPVLRIPPYSLRYRASRFRRLRVTCPHTFDYDSIDSIAVSSEFLPSRSILSALLYTLHSTRRLTTPSAAATFRHKTHFHGSTHDSSILRSSCAINVPSSPRVAHFPHTHFHVHLSGARYVSPRSALNPLSSRQSLSNYPPARFLD